MTHVSSKLLNHICNKNPVLDLFEYNGRPKRPIGQPQQREGWHKLYQEMFYAGYGPVERR